MIGWGLKSYLQCRCPVVPCFEDDNVTSSLDIGIPDEMWDVAKAFNVGDDVKVTIFFWCIGMVVDNCS